jgi:hypothetical protein
MPCRRLFVGLALILASPVAAQNISQRGFVEGRAFLFAQPAANDPTRAVGDLFIRDEVFVKPAPWIQFAGGLELRANTHDQVQDHDWTVDVADRRVRRPRLSIRRLSATVSHRGFTLDVGKQFIRWGKTDSVTPTDRFAPRDFLNVVDNEFLGVTGARATVQARAETFEAVWLPRFTPSRIPLLDQRWTAAPPSVAGVLVVDAGAIFPRGSQTGVRWSHAGTGFETSLSFFNGFNHLPDIDARVRPAFRPEIDLTRVYPALRTYGGDAAVPTRWFTIKAEAAYFTSTSPKSDEFVLYVVQLERQTGEWVLVGGYAGETVTRRRAELTFAPDRGLTRSVVGRASYTIDPIRSVAFDGAVRQTGGGGYARVEYSQAHGQHWRATITGVLIRGEQEDFLGQYRRNSHLVLSIRYSF